MLDAEHRRLERFLADDPTDLAAEVARLTLLRRTGVLSPKRIWRAAQLGDPAAKEVHGKRVREASHCSISILATIPREERLALAVKWVLESAECSKCVIGGAERVREWAYKSTEPWHTLFQDKRWTRGIRHAALYLDGMRSHFKVPAREHAFMLFRVFSSFYSTNDIVGHNADVLDALLMRRSSIVATS